MATTAKTFRTKRDAEDRARRTEDEMVRGAYIQRAPAERMTAEDGLKRYLAEVSPTKRQGSAATLRTSWMRWPPLSIAGLAKTLGCKTSAEALDGLLSSAQETSVATPP